MKYKFDLDLIKDGVTGRPLVFAKQLEEQLPDPSTASEGHINIAFPVDVIPGQAEQNIPVLRVEKRHQTSSSPDARRGLWIVGTIIVKVGTERFASKVVDENGVIQKVYVNTEP